MKKRKLRKARKAIRKGSPTASDVHVPTAGSEKKPPKPRDMGNFWSGPANLDVQMEKAATAKDTSATQMGSNYMDGMYDMQQIVAGIDWELEHGTPHPDLAKEAALSNLADNPDYYRIKRLEHDQTDDVLAQKDVNENEFASVTGWPVGLNLDLCSGACREPGYIGFDLYPHDHGTVVHDLTMGIPVPDGSVTKLRLFDGLEHLPEKDQKPLLSEIHRVMMPGGQFVYQGPNDIWNYPDWASDLPGLVLTNDERDDDQIDKADQPTIRQTFTRIAVPDAATANDAEPRIGVATEDQLPADALLAMDAIGYSWSDATSSGRGNRVHGYPSQGSLLSRTEENSLNNVGMQKAHDPENIETLEEALTRFFDEEEAEKSGVSKVLVDEDVRGGEDTPADNDYALPDEQRYPINDVQQAITALTACSGRAEEENVKNAVYRKFPQLRGDVTDRGGESVDDATHIFRALLSLGKMMSVGKGQSWLDSGGGGDDGGIEKDELTAEGRDRISDDNFALPKERKYPIQDISHARNALARVAQHGTQAEQKRVKAAVYGKYPSLNPDVKKNFVGRIVPIKKAVPMKQIAYCVVLTPEELDAQDDWMTPEDIEDAAHIFMQNSREIGSNHTESIDATPVESYIAPQDLHWNEGPYGPQVVKQGSWVIGIKVHDPSEWRKVLSGEYQGVSVGGFGLRL